MSGKSAARKTVRKSVADLSTSSSDLARLRAAMAGAIDTGDIPERRKFDRVQRDKSGRLPARRSMIREAIAREMGKLNITAYRLWQLARPYCPTLSQSAVHEFLKGQRQLELPSAEALLAAVHLRIVRRPARGKKQGAQKGASRAS
jgi:hypothetical protein